MVDHEIYSFDSKKEELSVEALKEQMSAKLKYVISDKDHFDPYESLKKQKQKDKIIIPPKYTQFDKIRNYGGKIEDPFAINTTNIGDMEARVFTHKLHMDLPQKRDDAIRLIQATFDKAKDLKAGMSKPGSNGTVTAKRVYDVRPMLQAIPYRLFHVINDDQSILTDNLPIKTQSFSQMTDDGQKEVLKAKYQSNLGQVLVSFDDKFNQDDKGNAEKKKALYKWDHQEGLDTEVGKTLLGKRANGQRDATQFEHIRDYAMSLKKNSA